MDSEFKQTVVGTYDRAAHLYDQVGARRFTYFGGLLVERLNLPAGAQVLDLASGRGALLLAAAEKVGSGGRVIGIDLAPQMVALNSGRDRAARANTGVNPADGRR